MDHPSHKINMGRASQDTSEKNSRQVLPIDTDKLKGRVRAFTGAFVVMISPVLLGIVLKKVNLVAAGKYQGIRRLEVFFNFVQGSFAHLAAATLQMGTLPFLCVMISEACASLAPLRYVAPRLLIASKVLVFISNISLMILGCGILLLIHKKAWLVLSLCSIMVIVVIVVHIIWFRHRCCVNNIGGTTQDDEDKYHSRLEHLLELSAGITVMMFLVLECVALEGLLRNSQGQAGFLPQALAPAPSDGLISKGQETFLGATLIISFFTSASGVLLMNVWTTPLVVSNSVVLTAAFVRGLNFCLQALPIAVVVILITLDVLPHAWKYELVWIPVFPTFTVFLVWLARRSIPQKQRNQEVGQAGAVVGRPASSASSDSDKAQQPEEPEDQKPAPLELTKVAFTGFLAVAVPNVTNASAGIPCILFVLFTAAAVLLGLSWRLLTHEAKSEAVLKAANHASFCAHLFISLAGGAFWVMAVNASK
ncbi:unnamed protein product [Urochloa humidicola]